MSLVNAAYFKGQWVSQFDPSETRIDNFYVKRDKIKIARFMKQKGAFNYYLSEELRAHVLQLPYQVKRHQLHSANPQSAPVAWTLHSLFVPRLKLRQI